MMPKSLRNHLFIVLSMVCANHNFSIDLVHVTDINQQAISYVGNTHVENGKMQLELLLLEGLQKNNFVLEIGCGALFAGIPIMSFLEENNYAGIEPNKWLIDATLQLPENKIVIDRANPQFLYNQ